MRATCRHCHRKKANRPRGLCWPCYYRPGVRDLYPASGSRYARRGVGTDNRRLPLPTTPTATVPGSPERVAVLAARAAAGVSLFHPDDTTAREPAGVGRKRGACRVLMDG